MILDQDKILTIKEYKEHYHQNNNDKNQQSEGSEEVYLLHRETATSIPPTGFWLPSRIAPGVSSRWGVLGVPLVARTPGVSPPFIVWTLQ